MAMKNSSIFLEQILVLIKFVKFKLNQIKPYATYTLDGIGQAK